MSIQGPNKDEKGGVGGGKWNKRSRFLLGIPTTLKSFSKGDTSLPINHFCPTNIEACVTRRTQNTCTFHILITSAMLCIFRIRTFLCLTKHRTFRD